MGSTGNAVISKPVNTSPISMQDGSIEISDDFKSTLFNITGTDRSDVLNKVAEALGGNLGNHQVFSGSSKNITFDNYIIDISTRKQKGIQVVNSFQVWQKDNRKTIRNFFR